jgi:hypothetical protein
MTYMRHFKYHDRNINLQVKCNECGHTCTSWVALRKKNSRLLKEKKIFNQYLIIITVLTMIFSQFLTICFSKKHRKIRKFWKIMNKLKNVQILLILTFMDNMLEMSYLHKLPEKSINTLNKNTENLILTLLLSSKVKIMFPSS